MSWGVLVYIVADERANTGTSLDEVAGTDLAKILKAASDTKIPIAAQIDYEGIPGRWRQIRGTLGATREPIRLREANSNRPEVLTDFLKWGRECLKTEHYLVMLWGHGAGPGGFFSDASKNTPAHVGHPLSPRLLARALGSFTGSSNNPPFDILLTKACFASTLEVALQLKSSTRFIIASQNLIPSQTFWPYRDLFRCLAPRDGSANGRPKDIQDTAAQLLDELGKFYSAEANRPGKTEVPYSLLDLEKGEIVADRVTELVTLLKENRINVSEAAARACPGDPGLLDVPRFCESLIELGMPEVARAAEALKTSVTAFVLKRQPRPSAFQGVSLFFHPGYGMSSPVRDSAPYGLYKRSELSMKTGWIDIAFQNTIVEKMAGTIVERMAEQRRLP